MNNSTRQRDFRRPVANLPGPHTINMIFRSLLLLMKAACIVLLAIGCVGSAPLVIAGNVVTAVGVFLLLPYDIADLTLENKMRTGKQMVDLEADKRNLTTAAIVGLIGKIALLAGVSIFIGVSVMLGVAAAIALTCLCAVSVALMLAIDIGDFIEGRRAANAKRRAEIVTETTLVPAGHADRPEQGPRPVTLSRTELGTSKAAAVDTPPVDHSRRHLAHA